MRIDFYVLKEPGGEARERFACRIAEKAFGLGQRLHLLVGDAGAAQRLDELLWTFRAGSFLPHAIDPAGGDPDHPITVGAAEPPELSGQVLVNLQDEVPACFERFERVVEIVAADESSRQAARRRFSFYR
ncbi:MAG: DNA polymerase III subunit chi, partial [Gammaproteobacteria bacterium]